MRALQGSHDEALGSAQQEAVALARQLQELQAEVINLPSSLCAWQADCHQMVVVCD